jgi:hypothetical protein
MDSFATKPLTPAALRAIVDGIPRARRRPAGRRRRAGGERAGGQTAGRRAGGGLRGIAAVNLNVVLSESAGTTGLWVAIAPYSWSESHHRHLKCESRLVP